MLMLTPRQAFKVAFLIKCAADGWTPEEAIARVEQFCNQYFPESQRISTMEPLPPAAASGLTKQAFLPALLAGGAALTGGALAGLGSLASGTVNAGGRLLSSLGSAASNISRTALPLAILLPVGLGALLGYAHSVQKQEAEKVSPEEYQARELITAYRRASDIARRKAEQKKKRGQEVVEVYPIKLQT
jgi:hypothetical protein